MDLNLNPEKNSIILEGYGQNYFKICGKKIFSPVLLFPDQYFPVKTSKFNIKNKIMDYDNKYKIDLIILGSPLGLLSPKDNFFTDLKSLHLPVEFMNTGAACRTWTVLIGEGRCVCAFLKTDA